MADEEVRQRVAKLIRDGFLIKTPLDITDHILALIKEAGYRKVTGRPPLLSDEERRDIWVSREGTLEAIAKAQRDADVKFYKGG